jgi:hypothetical protein
LRRDIVQQTQSLRRDVSWHGWLHWQV